MGRIVSHSVKTRHKRVIHFRDESLESENFEWIYQRRKSGWTSRCGDFSYHVDATNTPGQWRVEIEHLNKTIYLGDRKVLSRNDLFMWIEGYVEGYTRGRKSRRKSI